MIDGHGDDLHRYPEKVIHNFSSNIYYKGCPADLLEELKQATQTIQNYPSPAAGELSSAASRRFGLPSDCFLFTNGATEAFYLIAHHFSGKKAAIAAPTFSEYEDACKAHGITFDLIDQEVFNASDYELVFLCNPNNPDGSILSPARLATMIEGTPATTFVIDEAYIEFTNHTSSMLPRIEKFPNLIVVRSLTKTFAVPGIRLGYLVASSKLVQQLLAKKMPWSVNALAIRAGLMLFEHYDEWLFNVEELLDETRDFIQALSAIDWLKVSPTNTSYFLVKLNQGTAKELKHYLVSQHGILIRDATNFHGLEGQYIRLSTQHPEANNTLIEALKQWN